MFGGMINAASEAIGLLCALPDLDYVVIDEWVFDKTGCGKEFS